jgi:hypothetical protein
MLRATITMMANEGWSSSGHMFYPPDNYVRIVERSVDIQGSSEEGNEQTLVEERLVIDEGGKEKIEAIKKILNETEIDQLWGSYHHIIPSTVTIATDSNADAEIYRKLETAMKDGTFKMAVTILAERLKAPASMETCAAIAETASYLRTKRGELLSQFSPEEKLESAIGRESHQNLCRLLDISYESSPGHVSKLQAATSQVRKDGAIAMWRWASRLAPDRRRILMSSDPRALCSCASLVEKGTLVWNGKTITISPHIRAMDIDDSRYLINGSFSIHVLATDVQRGLVNRGVWINLLEAHPGQKVSCDGKECDPEEYLTRVRESQVQRNK